jgi:hypothetical protein
MTVCNPNRHQKVVKRKLDSHKKLQLKTASIFKKMLFFADTVCTIIKFANLTLKNKLKQAPINATKESTINSKAKISPASCLWTIIEVKKIILSY